MLGIRATLIACVVLLAAAPAHAISIYTADMSGANEVPPNASPATGFSAVTVDGNSLTVDMTWTGLIGGPPTAAHIHCCTAPGTNINVAVGFDPFPTVTTGNFHEVFDLLDVSIYTASFLANFGGGTAAGARDALLAGLDAGLAYTNIHNATFPGGEIRGNLELTSVPEPASLVLLLAGLGGMGLMRRRLRGG